MRRLRHLAVVHLAVLTTSCGLVTPFAVHEHRGLVPLSTEQCRAVLRDDASADSLRNALARSAEYLERIPGARQVAVLDRAVRADALAGIAQAADRALAAGSDPAVEICGRSRVYRVELPAPMLVTGYYEPVIAASRTRSDRFRHPLYRAPDDLVEIDLRSFCTACAGRRGYGRVDESALVPYYARSEIAAGALAGKDYELAWLEDPVDAFFIHVQGSATLCLEDGTTMQVGYAASNGRPYTSIGRLLAAQRKLEREQATLQGLKAYLRAHPDEQAEILATNERYVFFRTVAAGPLGSIGVPLTAGRSIAADRDVYPPGALVFLRILERTAENAGATPLFSRFATIQDTGAAIEGPGRIDVFWGTGADGEMLAGGMSNPGEIYLILPD